MNLDQLKPSHFLAQPMNSTLQSSESETVARNIMAIRKRLGDTWPLTWKEYKRVRVRDGGFSTAERTYFGDVIKLIPDALGAITFAPAWAKAARKVLRTQHEVDIVSDGITVWVNSETVCLGRFGRHGIDVHATVQGDGKPECLHCTHEPTTAADWDVFVAKMLEHHGAVVSEKYRPDRFKA